MSEIKSILLIDDDEAANFYHKIVIEDSKLANNIAVVLDGQEAIEYLTCTGKYADQTEKPNPDIIFLDINMPRMNGFEFLDAYSKLDENNAGRVIVMLTTSLLEDDKNKCDTYDEVQDFKNKPLTEDYLKLLIKNNS